MSYKKWATVVCFMTIFCAHQIGFLAQAPEVVRRDDLQRYFAGYTTGTFILYDEDKNQYGVYNEPQSKRRLSPCSTFKIFNALIGLETGVLDKNDARTLRKWDGKQRALPGWNRDHTLASAIRESAVWYFQDLASRIGNDRMQTYIDRIGYGNRDLSGGLTTFWLSSSLQISAREQVDLLHKLYAGELPVSPENVEIVKRDITVFTQDRARLMGKTGSGMEKGRGNLGWFVGCLERDGKRYFFAANVEAEDGVVGGKVRGIVEQILRDEALLD